jgi:hypothetical protein
MKPLRHLRRTGDVGEFLRAAQYVDKNMATCTISCYSLIIFWGCKSCQLGNPRTESSLEPLLSHWGARQQCGHWAA